MDEGSQRISGSELAAGMYLYALIVSWMESADGYTLMYDSRKYVVYAQTDGQGNLIPSNIRFGNNTQPNANITKGLISKILWML